MTTLETVSPRLFLMPCFTTPTSRKIFSIKAFRFSVQYYHKTGDGTFCVRGENMYGDNFKNQENTKISFNPRARAGRDSDDPARAGHRQRFNGATSFQTWKHVNWVDSRFVVRNASMGPRLFRRGNTAK